MFQRLGQLVARRWQTLVVLWGLALVGAIAISPRLEDVEQSGEFAFLPSDSPSLIAERKFAAAFPNHAQASTIAVVVRRASAPLTPQDLDFIDNGTDDDANPSSTAAHNPVTGELIERVRRVIEDVPIYPHGSGTRLAASEISTITFRDRSLGEMLQAPDGHASLILLELPTEFLDAANTPLVHGLEQLLFENEEFRQTIPPGLELYLSGTAVVGRDMLETARDSAKATEHLTIILVVALLILIYRAPLLALVPLTTVFVSVKLTMHLLCWMAGQGWVVLFTGIESYVTVLVYGAGVDYCLFLIARFKEEVDKGIPLETALVDSVGSVGAAIAASAGTVICGIGMMIFAEFGKFRDAGVAISFGLVIVLCASLTLTPAMLRSTGHWLFWPRQGQIHMSDDGGTARGLQAFWVHVAGLLERRPVWLWLGSLAAMIPFACVGVWFFSDLSYGLLTDLPSSARSVVGTRIVQEHFSDGITGPISVLIHADNLDFEAAGDQGAGIDVVSRLNQWLMGRKEELLLDDVRSVAFPLGGETGLADIQSPAVYRLTRQRALFSYVGSSEADAPPRMTRLELITADDPFSRDSIQHLNALEAAVRTGWSEVTTVPAQFYFLGATASIRDLKSVTDRDQVRIDLLATAGVFIILVALLRRTAICVYLILSVLLSYLATLGVTYLTFWALDGAEFAGLDWKVPMFLFTILIAVGEDYNIFLMTRVAEEQQRLGRIPGIIHALTCTGRIISSCGIIMAGTFASLAAGSLRGMAQLGFALAFGVLLDTFVVRPILVPAYLVLVERGAFGPLSRWLGQLPPDAYPAAEAPQEPVLDQQPSGVAH